MSERQDGGGWAARLAAAIGLKPQQANLVKLLAVGLAIGLLFLNAGELFGLNEQPTRPESATQIAAPPGAPQDELTRMEADLARSLERTLSAVAGAGKVHVTVMLEAGPTISVVADTRVDKTSTKETAADNSTRETVTTNTTTTNVVTRSGSSDSPAVMKKSRAQIAGVLIVAEGARASVVRARLHEAAVTALGISPNRITVTEAGRD